MIKFKYNLYENRNKTMEKLLRTSWKETINLSAKNFLVTFSMALAISIPVAALILLAKHL